MVFASASLLATAVPRTLPLSRAQRHARPRSTLIVCHSSEPKKWRAVVSTALAAAIVSFGGIGPMTAMADLNKYEAEMRGEFGIGSAAQFGSADLKKAVHVNENFRRANFTAADMRESDFSGSTFNGAYLEKAVAYKANFSGADLSDTLMDRMVLNEANLTNAVLVRSVLTRSDLGGAIIEGADFSDAVLDLLQKQVLSCVVQVCKWYQSDDWSEHKKKSRMWEQSKKCLWEPFFPSPECPASKTARPQWALR
ncbi:thylakoid lumenal protein TL20.3, chloroplastic isoform X2 [Phoenix dactylifera]|uniref:Thylakoid lumenal protein TL20.3, chloroplastic isoform X2 n=1 Tax=Phoenix dactylifera TaxID=42345 RepID=A0A8B9A0D9_PHODC|nr:thylakoid lumenal protein TL20.3, chloroplastic isoform X2 [Phoenix dactylifera]